MPDGARRERQAGRGHGVDRTTSGAATIVNSDEARTSFAAAAPASTTARPQRNSDSGHHDPRSHTPQPSATPASASHAAVSAGGGRPGAARRARGRSAGCPSSSSRRTTRGRRRCRSTRTDRPPAGRARGSTARTRTTRSTISAASNDQLQRERPQMIVGQRRKRQPRDLDDERVADVERVVVHPLVLGARRQPFERRRQIVQQRVGANRQQIDLADPALAHARSPSSGRSDRSRARPGLDGFWFSRRIVDARVHPLQRDRDDGERDQRARQPLRRRGEDAAPRNHWSSAVS